MARTLLFQPFACLRLYWRVGLHQFDDFAGLNEKTTKSLISLAPISIICNMINEHNAKMFCCEDISRIENYELAKNDNDQIWDCHHRAEILPCGKFTPSELKKFGLYFQQPANCLIFLRHCDHTRLHNIGNKYGLGKKHTAEWKKKMSKKMHGRKISEEHRRKISESSIGKHHSEETKIKMSQNRRGANNSFYGKHHSDETIAKLREKCGHKGAAHHMFGKHHSDETKKKLSQKRTGMLWWNNGIINKTGPVCPGPDFVRGQLKKSRLSKIT